MRTRRTRLGGLGLVATALVASVAGCLPAPSGQAPEAGSAAAPPPLLRSAIDRAACAGVVRVAFGEPARAPGAAGGRGRAARAADRVYVPLCNQSGYWGTICRIRGGGILDDAAWEECRTDARHRCGAITYPLYLGYDAPPLTNLAATLDEAAAGRCATPADSRAPLLAVDR